MAAWSMEMNWSLKHCRSHRSKNLVIAGKGLPYHGAVNLANLSALEQLLLSCNSKLLI